MMQNYKKNPQKKTKHEQSIEPADENKDLKDQTNYSKKFKELEEKFGERLRNFEIVLKKMNILNVFTDQLIFCIVLIQDNKIIYINNATEQILEYKKDEIYSWSSDEFYKNIQYKIYENEEELNKFKSLTQKHNFRSSKLSKIVRIISKTGEIKYIEKFSKSILIDGKVSELIIGRNITEKIRIEQELERDRIRLQKNESISLLAGGLAHDFNNILVGILGNISLMKLSNNLDAFSRECLSDIEYAAKRANDLTLQLLKFSKNDSVKKQYAYIQEILDRSISLTLKGTHIGYELITSGQIYGADISKNNLNFKIKNKIKYGVGLKGGLKDSRNLDDKENIGHINGGKASEVWKSIPPTMVNEGQISQVFNNLLINAVQAMTEGGNIFIKMEVISNNKSGKTLLKSKNNEYIHISFRDEGGGIPESIQDRIFEPYFTTKPNGNGIGLATAFSIIRNHGGLFTFNSEPGIGTTFHVYIPIISDCKEDSDLDTIQNESCGDINLEGESEPKNRGNIIILDDDIIIHKTANRIFRHLGFNVINTYSIEEALEVFKEMVRKKQNVFAILLDLILPESMGYLGLIKEIKKIKPAQNLILVTGNVENKIFKNYKDYGFDYAMEKPFGLDQIIKQINQIEQNI